MTPVTFIISFLSSLTISFALPKSVLFVWGGQSKCTGSCPQAHLLIGHRKHCADNLHIFCSCVYTEGTSRLLQLPSLALDGTQGLAVIWEWKKATLLHWWLTTLNVHQFLKMAFLSQFHWVAWNQKSCCDVGFYSYNITERRHNI